MVVGAGMRLRSARTVLLPERSLFAVMQNGVITSAPKTSTTTPLSTQRRHFSSHGRPTTTTTATTKTSGMTMMQRPESGITTSSFTRKSPFIFPSIASHRFLSSSYHDDDNDGYGDDDNENSKKRVKKALVLGSSGALGSTVSRYLSQQLNFEVLGADVLDELPADLAGDWELDAYCPLPRQTPNLSDLLIRLVQGVDLFCDGKPQLDVIVCASGGWQPDPPPVVLTAANQSSNNSAAMTETEHRNSRLARLEAGAAKYGATVDDMLRKNLDPVVAASFIAQYYMNPGNAFLDRRQRRQSSSAADSSSLMVVIGATPALGPTPGMMGYGLSKAAAHFVVQTFGACTGTSTTTTQSKRQVAKAVRASSSLDHLDVIGILPTTIDTPNNRKARPNENFEQWTKPLDIAAEIGTWITTPAMRPHSGSLVKVAPAKAPATGAVFTLVR